MNLNNTTLDLNKSTDARAFDDNEILHSTEYKLVSKWIKDDIDSALLKDKKGKFDRHKRHDTITILGTRGSGKTSFLLSLLTWLDNEFGEKVEVLEIIDPTLIEEKGHIFLDVFSIIQNKVERVLESDLGASPELIAQGRIWSDMITKLAHGLPHIDGIGGNLTDATWQDPEYIMQRGLRSVKAARNLEVNFTEVVSTALTILGKQAFVIAFDDIDIDFKKGWPVLELLRKYFVSKQLITILSGDMRLYSLAIRKKQWQNFGEEIIMQEGKTPQQMDHLRDLVTETESQYLQKVMKPSRRVHLTTLYEKFRIYPDTSIEVTTIPGRSASIQNVYREIFNRHGINNNYQFETYKSFLLNSPVRLQIRFLEANIGRDKFENSGFIDPFISDLYEMRIDVERITGSSQQLNITILELLLREKILSETNQLQPTTSKPALNGTLTALTLLFSQTSETDPTLSFDYLVRIGYLRNLLSSLSYQQDDNIGERDIVRPTIQGLCKHSGILQDRVIKDNIGMVTAYMCAVRALDGNSDRPWAGIVPLRALGVKSRTDSETNRNRINIIADQLDPVRRSLILFPLSISQSSLKQRGTVIYSFHSLLATISEFIRKTEHDDLFRGIGELSQIRHYPMPDFRQTSERFDEIDEQLDESYNDLSSTQGYEQLENMLKKWYKLYPKKAVPPHLLGKISTRFFFAADTIQNIQKNEKLGDIMHALTVAFLNSVLVEDIKEHIVRPDININNPRMSDNILVNNLKKLDWQLGDKLKLSKWIFSCPLLLAYLRPDNELVNEIYDFADENLAEESISYSVYFELMKINPKYRLIKPKNYDKIIHQIITVAKNIRLSDATLSSEELQMINHLYLDAYPGEKLSLSQLKKVLDYYQLEDAE